MLQHAPWFDTELYIYIYMISKEIKHKNKNEKTPFFDEVMERKMLGRTIRTLQPHRLFKTTKSMQVTFFSLFHWNDTMIQEYYDAARGIKYRVRIGTKSK